MRSTVLKFFAGAMAAASLMAFAAPTYAGTADDTAQARDAWCDIVPPYCACNNTAQRCCKRVTVEVRAKGVEAKCPFIKE